MARDMSEAPGRIYAGPVKPAFTNKKPGRTGEWYIEPMPNCDVPFVRADRYDEAVRQRDKAVEALKSVNELWTHSDDEAVRDRHVQVAAALAACEPQK